MVNLVAGTAPGGRSLTPQDKGSLGKKKKLPVFVVTAIDMVATDMAIIRLPVFSCTFN
jgi:acyl CoA:acetate/3-ketoacid CoA transferase beta subunit